MQIENNKNTNLTVDNTIPTQQDWIKILKKLSVEQKRALSQFLDAMIALNEEDKNLTL